MMLLTIFGTRIILHWQGQSYRLGEGEEPSCQPTSAIVPGHTT